MMRVPTRTTTLLLCLTIAALTVASCQRQSQQAESQEAAPETESLSTTGAEEKARYRELAQFESRREAVPRDGLGSQTELLGLATGEARRGEYTESDAPMWSRSPDLFGNKVMADRRMDSPFVASRRADSALHPARVARALDQLAPGEELWVIVPAEGNEQAQAARPDDAPGAGALLALRPGEGDGVGEPTTVPVPLEHTDVQGSIAGAIAAVDVRQRFSNPFDEKIEAVYVFPLPQNAAVNGFLMTVGDRTIRGVIRERQEAERIYQEARSQGHVASLLTQERPNIFTQKVANIEPGKSIDIDIAYFHTLPQRDGWYEYVFPMVVGPRFNPPAPALAGSGVGAVDRQAVGASGQGTEVAYLHPTERSGHDVSLALTLDAGVEVEAIETPNHETIVEQRTGGRWWISLSDRDAIPNRDFVMRYRVAGDRLKAGVVVQREEGGGYFTMLLTPPASLDRIERAPVEFVFVIDASGSMSGRPMAQAKGAVESALSRMTARDTFQIIRFSNSASALGEAPLPATPENLRRARAHLRAVDAGGGTMMLRGIEAALDFPADPNRRRYVVFLTDGYIGNESQILSAMLEKIGEHRVFSFGVGSSVNRHLMESMAQVGRGAVAYVGLNDSAPAVMDRFFERVSRPAMTHVRIDWGEFPAADVQPQALPDLFHGRPIVVTGRLAAPLAPGAEPTIRVRGMAGGERVAYSVTVPGDAPEDIRGIDAVWARSRIAALMRGALAGEDGEVTAQRVRTLALRHNLVSDFTAFLAVDSLSRTAGEHGVSVTVPVPVPDGVLYETTVQGAGER